MTATELVRTEIETRASQSDNSPLGQAVRKISASTVAALREIGAESPINKRRVEQFYGVPLNPPQAEAAQAQVSVANVHDLGGVQTPE